MASADSPTEKTRLSRRRLLATAATAVAGVGLAGLYAWRIEPHWLEIVRRELPIERLPAALDGASLVQISDVHVGPVVDSEYLIASLRHISGLRPDLVVLTGDYMTYRHTGQIDEMARVFENLTPGPLGCVAILGNHDYGSGWKYPEVADKTANRLSGLGFHVLRNAAQSFAGLNIVGLDDKWYQNYRPAEALAHLDPAGANLVLCHNPDAVDDPAFANYHGWTLSGHTHGGQCKPPFLPPPMLPVQNRRYTAGEFALASGGRLYINRGLGYLRRVRFNVRPEITWFTLVRAENAEV